jgi:5-methylcytosine-specific restriction endonuclease McrA
MKKACSFCKIEKEINLFVKDNRNRSGFGARCKKCDSEASKKYAKNNKEKRTKYRQKYYENNKESIKEQQKQYRETHNRSEEHRAYRLKNKKKISTKAKEYREKNKERIKEKSKLYYQENKEKFFWHNAKRRSILRNASIYKITNKEKRKILNSICFACSTTENITIDHAIPLSRGGGHRIGNLIPLCMSCNRSKKNKTLTEWKYSGLHPSSRS